PPTTAIYPLSLHDALPILAADRRLCGHFCDDGNPAAKGGAEMTNAGETSPAALEALLLPLAALAEQAGRAILEVYARGDGRAARSEEHTSELQSRENLVCR